MRVCPIPGSTRMDSDSSFLPTGFPDSGPAIRRGARFRSKGTSAMKDPRDLPFPSATTRALARRFGALLLATAPLAGVAGAQLPNDYCGGAIQIYDGFNGLFSNVGATVFNLT